MQQAHPVAQGLWYSGLMFSLTSICIATQQSVLLVRLSSCKDGARRIRGLLVRRRRRRRGKEEEEEAKEEGIGNGREGTDGGGGGGSVEMVRVQVDGDDKEKALRSSSSSNEFSNQQHQRCAPSNPLPNIHDSDSDSNSRHCSSSTINRPSKVSLLIFLLPTEFLNASILVFVLGLVILVLQWSAMVLETGSLKAMEIIVTFGIGFWISVVGYVLAWGWLNGRTVSQ